MDGVEIQSYLRNQLKEQAIEGDLDSMIESITSAYMSRIEAAQSHVKANLSILNDKERSLSDTFRTFQEKMEVEMEECIQYLLELKHNKEKLKTRYLRKGEAIDDWKRTLEMEEIEFRENQKNNQMEYANQMAKEIDSIIPEAVSFTQKLFHLSIERPRIWRMMKDQELAAKLLEDEVKIKEECKAEGKIDCETIKENKSNSDSDVDIEQKIQKKMTSSESISLRSTSKSFIRRESGEIKNISNFRKEAIQNKTTTTILTSMEKSISNKPGFV